MPDRTVLTTEKEAAVRNEEYDKTHTPPIRSASNGNIAQEKNGNKSLLKSRNRSTTHCKYKKKERGRQR